MAWRITPTATFKMRFKWYEKKKPKELKAVLDNLDTLIKSLHSGKKPKPFVYGFLSAEPSDVIRISEAGSETQVAATRLYVYPDTGTDTLYLLTIGDKPSQSDDIKDCKRIVKDIKADPYCGGDEDDGDDEKVNPGEGDESPAG